MTLSFTPTRIALLAACLILAHPRLTLAQPPIPAAPAFDVATIKPGSVDDPNNGQLGWNEDKFITHGQSLKMLIKFAYDLNMGASQQISGGPPWLDSAKFDIEAKEDPETAAALQKLPGRERPAQMRILVRALLADRFNLKVHHETKELPVYALVVAKSGIKMTPSVDAPPTPGTSPDGPKRNTWQGLSMQGRGQLEGRAADTGMFTNIMAMQPEISGRMVIDKTGLTGKYDFILKWTPDTTLGTTPLRPDAGVAPDPSGPSLFTALQEELGLKLESTKAPVDTIVIDAATMPTQN